MENLPKDIKFYLECHYEISELINDFETNKINQSCFIEKMRELKKKHIKFPVKKFFDKIFYTGGH